MLELFRNIANHISISLIFCSRTLIDYGSRYVNPYLILACCKMRPEHDEEFVNKINLC